MSLIDGLQENLSSDLLAWTIPSRFHRQDVDLSCRGLRILISRRLLALRRLRRLGQVLSLSWRLDPFPDSQDSAAIE